MQFKEAGHYIIGLLEKELPAHLLYHNANHTLDVYHAADRLGRQEGVGDNDMKLLVTAAWFHDSGQMKGSTDHEMVSCEIAKEILPIYDFTPVEIDKICGIIMATKLPQTPLDRLGEILADADLDYLGRDDFFDKSESLFNELCLSGNVMTRKEWNLTQVDFLGKHKYFTKSACAARAAKKEENLQLIKAEFK
jgi:uncharacterized protein